jgi:hypothetical protein
MTTAICQPSRAETGQFASTLRAFGRDLDIYSRRRCGSLLVFRTFFPVKKIRQAIRAATFRPTIDAI